MPISVDKFYGTTHAGEDKIQAILLKKPLPALKPEPPFLRGLLGPSLTWKVFRKQADALDCAKKGCHLMSFAFEMPNGERAFLTCHPLRLWYQHDNWRTEQKCTYEIIPEGAKCKLYLDVEFEYEFNPGSCFNDGESKLCLLIKLIVEVIKEVLKCECSADDVLDLDSSTSSKFSRHLILNLRHAAFDNNLSVGNFVIDFLRNVSDKICKDEPLFDVPLEDLLKLKVFDRKGQEKFIVDTAVYTRNRHFRLLGSTKLNKNAPLAVSKVNKYIPSSQQPYAWLLASLVTYFDQEPHTILTYGPIPCAKQQLHLTPRSGGSPLNLNGSELSNFINQLASPNGRIRQITRDRLGDIKFDIAGYRFCGNIGREHRSNNIAIIVNMQTLAYHQICYDPDCSGYKSSPTLLPPAVIFACEDDSFLTTEVLTDLMDDSFENIDDGISDTELIMVLDETEAAISVLDYI